MSAQPRKWRCFEATAVAALLAAAGCENHSALRPVGTPALDRSVHAHVAQDELFRSARRATARFHSTVQALDAGYHATHHCVDVAGLGGMGYHWVNPGLVDPEFDPLKPEVMLYATGPGENLRPVAIEYIVIDMGQDQPSFGGQPFDVGGTPVPVPHWSLHVWLYQENEYGIYSPFNPAVMCP